MTQNASVETLLRQGHDQLNRGQNKAGLETFQQAAELEPQNPQVLNGMGLACYRLERYQESVEYLNQALQIQPSYILALARRGMVYQGLKLDEQATADFEQAIQFEPQNHEDWRGRGLALDDLKRYEEAIASQDRAIELKPDDYNAWNNRGGVLYDLGRYEEAFASYDKALELKPDFYYAWNGRGSALWNLGRYEEALASYDKALAIQPDDYYVWNNRGNALWNLGRYEEAFASFDKAIEIKPDHDSAWNWRGNALWNLGRNEEALASYDRAIKLQPDSYEDWINRGNALNNLGRYEEALASYDRAIKLQPDSYEAWNYRGIALNNLERYEEALASYDRAIKLQPDSYEAWNNRGRALLNLKRYEEALASYDRAIKLQPDSYEDWNYRGIALNNLERYEEALASYDRAIKLQPDFYYAWNYRGIALNNLERYEEALASYDRAIKLQPDSYEDWNNQGRVLLNLERYEEALASYDRVIKLQPDSYEAWNNQGRALLNLKRYEEALASYDRAIKLQPGSYEAWNYRGIALLNLKRYEEALASYNRAIKLQPDSYEAWNNRGSALLNLKRYEEALASYDRAIELQPDYQDVWSSRGVVLCDFLKRYKEALASFDKAIEFKADDYVTWSNRGVALHKLGRYEEAIVSHDKAIEIKFDCDHAWNNRGWALFNLNRYEKAFQNWKEGRQHLQLETPEHREGRGELYCSQGQAYYLRGQQQQSNPFDDWLKAKHSYQEAFKFLDSEKSRKKRLQVLQDLIQVCQYISQPGEVQELLRQGTDLLKRLVQEPNLEEEKYIELEQQFAGFNQLQVDALAQSPDQAKQIEALELAEERKNTCLGWLQYGRKYKASRPSYQQMQRLLNSRTAAIYWHVSPAAITTFILKHDQLPISSKKRSPFPFFSKQEKRYPPAAYQLREFESWLSEWKQDYQKYRQVAETAKPTASRQASPWWQRMEPQLRRLENILDISSILPSLEDVDQLILIPHRDLHLLPLHYLFPSRFTITYLPSAQIGWNLQPAQSIQSLLNLENPRCDLHFATVSAIVISWLYPQCQLMEISALTKEQVIKALNTNTGTFQFTGHAYHKIEEPKESALLLANKEKLTLADIFETLNFGNYHLVFLSACETGITSPQNPIDEYVGLVSAFLAKGASYVISTLWTVDELSTALLMIRCYQFLKAGVTPAPALKQAQDWLRQLTYPKLAEWYHELAQGVAECDRHCSEYLETLAQEIQTDSDKMIAVKPPFEHPYHWAGFILTGKPPQESI